MFYKISVWGAMSLLLATSATAQGTKAALLECREKGGRTPKGAYFVNFTIRKDGTAQFENNDGKRTAKLSKADTTQLMKEIERADYKALTASQTGKMSPVAYDGIETIYIFYPKGQARQIPTYKYNLPPNATLFTTVEAIRKRYKL